MTGILVTVTEVATSVTTTHQLNPVAVEVGVVEVQPQMIEVSVPGQAGPPGRRGIFVQASPPTGTEDGGSGLEIGDIWLRPA